MINVLISKESRYPASREVIKKTVCEVLKDEGIKRKVEVGVSIVGDRKMRQLNKRYRNKQESTDVLSFPLAFEGEGRGFINPPDQILRLGDIVISYPQAVKNAAGEEILVDEEITRLVKHGLFHLLGIHHE